MVMYCCVFGCETKGTKNFVRFPKEDKVVQIWLKRIGSTKLLQLNDKKRLRNYKICLNHFHKMCLMGSRSVKKIKYRSLPTINLPGFDGKSNKKSCFLYDDNILKDSLHADNKCAAIKEFLQSQSSPIVFKNILKWDCFNWNISKWQQVFDKDTLLEFRIGRKNFTNVPQYETTTNVKPGSFQDLLQYNESKELWAYFDYKYLNKWFVSNKSLRKNICWGNLGYPDRGADSSTIWIGTVGAHTTCHIDSYGFNIVAQVYGRKEWILFPPDEDLKPSRIPYEESTIFSKLNLYSPNVDDFKHVNKAYSVTLNPGEVLLVPNGWWHYVENLDFAISINIWIEHKTDYINHCREAAAQLLVAQLTRGLNEIDHKSLVIPSSEDALLRNVYDHAKTIQMYSNPSRRDDSHKGLNRKDMNLFKENYVAVPQLSALDFRRLLLKKRRRFNNSDSKTVGNNNETVPILQQIVEYVTNPNILNPLTDNLINELWPKP